MRVLVVEDEPSISAFLKKGLEEQVKWYKEKFID